MKEFHLKIPLVEEDVLSLSLGDLVYVNGPIFTGRSLFHIRAIRENILPPLDFETMNVMVHMGPMMKRDEKRWVPVSCEPTTSLRFEKYGAEVIRRVGLRALVGKGTMGQKTMQAMKEYGCIHLAKIGIYGTILASRITQVLGVHGLEELGPIECTWVMEVKNFGPFFVDIDARGQSLFEKMKRQSRERLLAAYQRFSIPEELRVAGDRA
jgi:tartrate/fumarate subfamily iron-sulfur-dependent hydro-lyase beta chain